MTEKEKIVIKQEIPCFVNKKFYCLGKNLVEAGQVFKKIIKYTEGESISEGKWNECKWNDYYIK